jgi:hypothetical protein
MSPHSAALHILSHPLKTWKQHMSVLQPKFCSELKPVSVCHGILTIIMLQDLGLWGWGGGRGSSLHAVIEDIRERTVPYVWYSIQTRSVHSTPSPLCVCVCVCVYVLVCVAYTLWLMLYSDIPEEFIMPIWFFKKKLYFGKIEHLHIFILQFGTSWMNQKFP